MKIDFDRAATRFADAITDDNAAVFAGAGLSIASGHVSWSALLRETAKELGVELSTFSDLPSLAQYHVNETGNRGGVNRILVEEFVRKTEETDSHRVLSNLPIRTFWTTNYDVLIEQALQNAGKVVQINRRPEDLTFTVKQRDAVVYKMHGDVTELHRGVLTRDDYEQYDRERGIFRSALEGDLVQKTFLFVGFSFDDPNIHFVLSKTRVALSQSQREHYYLLKEVQKSDFDHRFESQKERDSAYVEAKAIEELRIRDLSRYGIRTVLLKKYSDVHSFFAEVNRRYRRQSVFISGAADDFSPFEDEDARGFLRELAGKLVTKGYRVINGFGKGIGPSVIHGVLDNLGNRPLEQALMSRPFPIDAEGDQRERLNEANREAMIREAGVAIFLFGNKRKGKKIEKTEGVKEEFELALKNNVPCIPIGCTGTRTMSRTLAKELVEKAREVAKQPLEYSDVWREMSQDGFINAIEEFQSKRTDLCKQENEEQSLADRIIELVEQLKDGSASAFKDD